MRVGVGIVTHKRPAYFEEAAAAVVERLGGVVDWVGAVHDGPNPGGYTKVPGCPLRFTRENRGVAAAKNVMLKAMIAGGCDWLFMSEDDVVVESPEAVTGFIEACEASGWEHLGWPFHDANDLVAKEGPVSYWWAMPGAWTVTSARAVLAAGMLDEGFVNCHEHYEWTMRLAEHGFTSGWRQFAAPTGCETWLREQPDALATSTIRSDPHWPVRIAAAQRHWQRAHPTSYAIAFP